MNKLESEIYESLLKAEGIYGIEDGNPISAGICKGHAEKAAQVALQWIRKFADHSCAIFDEKQKQDYIESWLRDNNLSLQTGPNITNGPAAFVKAQEEVINMAQKVNNSILDRLQTKQSLSAPPPGDSETEQSLHADENTVENSVIIGGNGLLNPPNEVKI